MKNTSILLSFSYRANNRKGYLTNTEKDMLLIVKSVNPTKAHKLTICQLK